MRGEWIEIFNSAASSQSDASLPVRGEWIEIAQYKALGNSVAVSPREGRVD